MWNCTVVPLFVPAAFVDIFHVISASVTLCSSSCIVYFCTDAHFTSLSCFWLFYIGVIAAYLSSLSQIPVCIASITTYLHSSDVNVYICQCVNSTFVFYTRLGFKCLFIIRLFSSASSARNWWATRTSRASSRSSTTWSLSRRFTCTSPTSTKTKRSA